MKRLFPALLALCAALALALPASGAPGGSVQITVNGVRIPASDSAYIADGTTMVPLRALAEALGCTVTWDGAARAVRVETPWAAEDPPRLSAVAVLDPGHGGASTGAAYDGVREKDLNLAIAERAGAYLEAAGVTVVMTRTDDRDVGLYERTALAAGEGADVFVSIHCNASVTNSAAAGVYTAAREAGGADWALAELLRRTVIDSAGAADMGTEARPHLAVLRTAAMPAALVECGFMSTPEELERLTDPDYQDRLARGIAGGVLAYLAPGTWGAHILDQCAARPGRGTEADALFHFS